MYNILYKFLFADAAFCVSKALVTLVTSLEGFTQVRFRRMPFYLNENLIQGVKLPFSHSDLALRPHRELEVWGSLGAPFWIPFFSLFHFFLLLEVTWRAFGSNLVVSGRVFFVSGSC